MQKPADVNTKELKMKGLPRNARVVRVPLFADT
jgi:hypothetical protein